MVVVTMVTTKWLSELGLLDRLPVLAVHLADMDSVANVPSETRQLSLYLCTYNSVRGLHG